MTNWFLSLSFEQAAFLVALVSIVVCSLAYGYINEYIMQHAFDKRQLVLDTCDEFEYKDDPYAVAETSRINLIDNVETLVFPTLQALQSWLDVEVPNDTRQLQLIDDAIDHYEFNGKFQITVELSSAQRAKLQKSIKQN